MARWRLFLIVIMIVAALIADCYARNTKKASNKKLKRDPLYRQQILQRRETTAVDFSRLVAMRLIYGIASMLGLRERVNGLLNGAFVPPGVEEDDYGFGFDDDDDETVDIGEFFDI